MTDNIYKVIAYRVHARGTRSFCRILPSSVIRHRSAELDFTCLKNSNAKIIKKHAKCKENAIYFLCKVKKVSLFNDFCNSLLLFLFLFHWACSLSLPTILQWCDRGTVITFGSVPPPQFLFTISILSISIFFKMITALGAAASLAKIPRSGKNDRSPLVIQIL